MTHPEAPALAIDHWLSAFNAADLEAISLLYAPDARLWGTTAAALIDTGDGVRAYFERVFALRPQPRMVLVEAHLRSLGDVAVISGRYDLQLAPGDVLPARFTLVLQHQREADRAGWRIVEHHSSRVPEAP